MGNNLSCTSISCTRIQSRAFHPNKSSAESVTTRNTSASSVKKAKKAKKTKAAANKVLTPRLGDEYVVKTLAEGTESDAMLTALKWVDAKNKHDMMRLYQVTRHDAIFHFPDTNVHLPMRPFWDSMMGLFDAAPDLSFSFSSIQELGPGKVLLRNYIGAGHHKGTPYEFPPHPPVPPSGAYISDEPMELTITVEGNLVVDMVADTLGGGIAGPPSFYAKAREAYEALNV